MDFILHILILIGIYTILSISLNLIAGYTGLLSLSHAAFYGVGAYVTALLSLHFNSPFLINLLLAMGVSGFLGFLVAIPSLRIHDDYFVIATFAFQVLIYCVLNNWISLTGGPLGLRNIPRPAIFGVLISSHFQFLILVYIFTSLAFFLAKRLVDSPFGRILKAIREDEVFAKALGKDVTRYKILIFIIGAAMAATAGALYASYITFIDPTSFTILESVFQLTIVIIGGAGNVWGSLIGTALLIPIPEALRFLGLPSSIAANGYQILYGVILVAFMLLRPQGIIGKYSFRKK